jgi:hypothetical protein
MKELDATIERLFKRYPQLHGFSVLDAASVSRDRQTDRLEGDLFLADLGVDPWGNTAELVGEIAVSLLELMDENPEARAQLSGRTFARTLH